MIPVPAIAHIVVKRVLHHFIVLYKISKKGVTYMDPADGKIHKATREEFEKKWTGILVLLEPNETFEKGNKRQV